MTTTRKISLSHNSLDSIALAHELHKFEGMSHEETLLAFEAKLCEITGSPYAVALNSGTAGIHLALKVAGVKTNDHVAVSTFTYVGSVNPIRYLNANPVFIDSEFETWNMDPNLLEDCLNKLSGVSKLPKAIEVVHTYGMPANMREILQVASRHDIPVIEDAAAGIGASYMGNSLGTLGDIGVLSFNNNKTITTFGGGALLTKSKSIYDKVKFLATQARENKPYYEFKEVGYNYRMGPLAAVYGLTQLRVVKEKIGKRRNVFNNYSEGLKGISEISFPQDRESYYSSRWLSAMLLNAGSKVTKEQVRSELEKQNIESRYLWNPMHKQPAFADYPYFGSGQSENLFNQGLCLPTGSELSADHQQEIISTIKNIFQF